VIGLDGKLVKRLPRAVVTTHMALTAALGHATAERSSLAPGAPCQRYRASTARRAYARGPRKCAEQQMYALTFLKKEHDLSI